MIMIYIKFESCPILMDFVYFFLLLLQVMHGLFQSFSQLGPKSKISISESPDRLFPWHYTTVSTARIGPRHYHCPKALRTASAAIVPMHHMKLDLQAHWNYFCRNVKERPQRPKFLGLQMSQN